ncbi:uncharacterized protein [Palaemon carinicauda]|uniref:uncharacterized protein n=1 Tax=Palaemon carinicauda TaxID=392227 RepID=UPI0035B5C37D
MTMDRRKSVATHLMTTAFLLASVTEGPTTSAETIARTFFYNPPANGGPPPDVLKMLAAGKTSGLPPFSLLREPSSQDPSDLRSTSYVENDNFQTGYPSVIDPDFLHASDVRESNHNIAMHWEPTREEPITEISMNSKTLTPLEGQKGNEDQVPAVIKDDILKSDPSRTETSKPGLVIKTGHAPQSSDGLDLSLNTEVPLSSSTEKYFQKLNEFSNRQSVDLETDSDLYETSSIDNELSDPGNSTEFPEEATSTNAVEEMTMDDSDGEITTSISLVPDAYAENGNQYYSDIKKIATKKETTANEEKKMEEKDKQNNSYLDVVDALKVANATHENPEKAKNNKKKTSIESRMNSIFFSIDEGPNEDGEIKVKIGKSLDHSSNLNTVEKNYKDVYQYNFHDPNTGWYKFGYGDNHQWRHEERSGDGVVLGRYGWHDANGREHTTHFVADAKGYRIVEPGQKITMHVGTPINKKTSNDKSGGALPSSLTTPRPSSSGRPTSQPVFSTTASLPITSVSTTLTLSTHASPGSLDAIIYPGTINDLIGPGLDLSLVGRPPIAHQLPPQSGSLIFAPSTKRPHERPPHIPIRTTTERNITPPFKLVNTRRRKPTRPIRPLKPLRQNLKRDPKPQETTSTDTSDEHEEEEHGILDSKPSENPDVIGQLQLFFNNSVKYPLSQGPVETDNSVTFTPNEIVKFINFINAFKQSPEAATSVNRPTWSKPQINNEEEDTHPFNYLRAPSKDLQPPPMPSSSSIYGASQDAFGDTHYTPDYAFMGLDPPIIKTPSFFNPFNGTMGKNPDTSSPSKNNESRPSEFPEQIPLKIYETKPNDISQEIHENNHLGSTTSMKRNVTQSSDSKNESTTSIPVTVISSESSLDAEKSTSQPELSSSSSKKPPANAIWPYIPVNTPSTSNPANSNVQKPPSQNIWSEVLKHFYYWPHGGSQDGRPTTIQ